MEAIPTYRSIKESGNDQNLQTEENEKVKK